MPSDFDMTNSPYIFLRFNDSVRALNMQTKRYVTLVRVPLSPAAVKYPSGSSLYVQRKDNNNPHSNYHLFTMGEFLSQN